MEHVETSQNVQGGILVSAKESHHVPLLKSSWRLLRSIRNVWLKEFLFTMAFDWFIEVYYFS